MIEIKITSKYDLYVLALEIYFIYNIYKNGIS